MSKSRVEEIIDRLGDEFKAVATAGLISAGTMGAHAAEPTSPEPSNAGHQITVTADNPNPLQVTPVEQGYQHHDIVTIKGQNFYRFTRSGPAKEVGRHRRIRSCGLAISEADYKKIVDGTATSTEYSRIAILYDDATYKTTKIGSCDTNRYTGAHNNFINRIERNSCYRFNDRVDERTAIDKMQDFGDGVHAVGDILHEGHETIREGVEFLHSLGIGRRGGRR